MTDQPRAACAGRWELFDSTQPADHLKARAICATCPILHTCAVKLAEIQHEHRHLARRGGGPVGTWAGQRVGVGGRSRRLAAEERMFTDQELVEAHRRYGRGRRDQRTLVGERVYQRKAARRQRQAKEGAA